MTASSITSEQTAAIRAVPHFRDGQYSGLDIPATLDYFRRRFVDRLPVKARVAADVGCGYGWLPMALALYGGAGQVIAIDPDAERLAAGRAIAAILGLDAKIQWRVGSVEAIPMADREADVTYCIEVLEHVYGDRRAFTELDRVTGGYLVLTTPNGAFPVVQHDTQLPFCHWLPVPMRRVYARLFGRTERENDNLFWTPWSLARNLPAFRRVSGFLHFAGIGDYLSLYPYYLPYGRGIWRARPSRLLRLFFRAANLLGRRNYLMLHNLAGTFRRIE